METLLELVSEMERLGEREAVLYDDGYRVHRSSYRDLLRLVAGTALRLDAAGIDRGDRLLLWGEGRVEWLAVFWAALSRGATVVPIDFRSSPAFVARVQADVKASLLAHGAAVDPKGLGLAYLAFEEVSALGSDAAPAIESADPSDVVQILYTSGTTGEPKGVVHRHRHLVANLDPIHDEIRKYTSYARPFQPIRFLDLLPLSHVFGQFTGLFVPVLLGGSVAFAKESHPSALVETIHRERISVLVAVPRQLQSLRQELTRRFGEPAIPRRSGLVAGLARWWRHRDVHGELGWKFWALLSGGARLPAEDEDYWYRLGFVLVQGYGLTETSSLVSTNHPFHPKRGSLGKAVGRQEIRLAPDGEILVRGDNVAREVFGRESGETASEWLATGDLGEIGEDGALYYRGRKKDVIVGPDGLNVYPMDVEAELRREPEVRDAVIIGRRTERGETVHAVLLLRDAGEDPTPFIERANRRLEPHQRVRGWTVWPGKDFPRTPSTFKVKRFEVQAAIEALARPDTSAPLAGPPSSARELIARQLGRRPEDLRDTQRLSEELGLSSLDRIELLSSLEEHTGQEISEEEMASVGTIEELERLVTEAPRGDASAGRARVSSPLEGLVRFSRAAPLRAFRWLFRETVTLPLFRHYLPLKVSGSLEGVEGPVLFAPNHTSHLDTLALLAALPKPRRDRLAPAMSQEGFRPYFEKTGPLLERATLALRYWLAVLLLNVFPLPQSTTGVRDALRFAGERVDEGYSILIFPEGLRSPDGVLKPFRAGVGLLAVRLGVPVVPVRIDGLFRVLSAADRWPKPGPVSLTFGVPLRFHENEDYREATARIEEAVRALAAR